MSSTLQAKSGVDTQALRADINRGSDNLHHVTPPNENLHNLQHKVIEEAAAEGKAIGQHLHHVQPPCDGVSDAVKQAYLDEHGKQQRGDKKECGKCGKDCKC